MQRFLVILGVVILVLGLLWPLIQKLGLGRLPGDIAIEKENFRFYFPVTTSIIISIVLSLVMWFFMRKWAFTSEGWRLLRIDRLHYCRGNIS